MSLHIFTRSGIELSPHTDRGVSSPLEAAHYLVYQKPVSLFKASNHVSHGSSQMLISMREEEDLVLVIFIFLCIYLFIFFGGWGGE